MKHRDQRIQGNWFRQKNSFWKSSNALIAMLEELLSGKTAAEKKHILTDEYGMVMTAE